MSLIKFVFEETDVRIVEDGESYWLVAKDVCQALGIAWRGSDTLTNIKSDWKLVRNLRTTFGNKNTYLLKEQAVYKLAFRSNKPSAEQFTEKTADLLARLRKDGYVDLRSKLSPESLGEHQKREIQIQNSKDINTYNYEKGGKAQIIKHNQRNCQIHTGMTAKKFKEKGRKLVLRVSNYLLPKRLPDTLKKKRLAPCH